MKAKIFTLLKKDHAEVKKLFKEIDGLASGQTRQRERLFKQLKSALEIHAKVEEALFYQPLKTLEKSHMQILEGIEEHNLVEKLLLELASGPVNSDEWCAKLTVLRENLLHHIEEEEGEIFPLAEKLLDAEALDEIGRQFEIQKQKLESSVMAVH